MATWAAVMAAAGLAGCSGASTSPRAGGAGATTTTAPPTSSVASTSSSVPGPGSTTSPAVQNLVVDDTLRTQLLLAAAAMDSLSASDYTGLVPGTTYYAYDSLTGTYWAGAGLVPSPSSQQAEVSVQDDGSYVLFDRTAGGAWHAQPDGLGGVGGTPCPSTLPAAVVAAWGWATGTCRPPG